MLFQDRIILISRGSEIINKKYNLELFVSVRFSVVKVTLQSQMSVRQSPKPLSLSESCLFLAIMPP